MDPSGDPSRGPSGGPFGGPSSGSSSGPSRGLSGGPGLSGVPGGRLGHLTNWRFGPTPLKLLVLHITVP